MTSPPNGFKWTIFNKEFRKKFLHPCKKHLIPSPPYCHDNSYYAGTVGTRLEGKILLWDVLRASQMHPIRMKVCAAPAPTIPGAGKVGESISHWSLFCNVQVGVTCRTTWILITADLYGSPLIFLLMSNLLICSLVLKGKQEKGKGVFLAGAALRRAKEQSRCRRYGAAIVVVARARIKLFKLFTLERGNFILIPNRGDRLKLWSSSAPPFQELCYLFSCLTSPK